MGLEAAHGDAPGIAAVVVIVLFWTIAVISTLLRIWARRTQRVRFVLNDYALILSLFATTGTFVVSMIGLLAGGQGKHFVDLSAQTFVTGQKIVLAGSIIWATANFLIKLSILDLYNRIFWKRPVKIISYILMALSFCLLVAIILQAFLICKPLAYNWNLSIKGGRCGNQNQGFLAQAITNLLLDVMIVSLPLPVLWGLQMRAGKKVSITIMFSIGYCICILTGLRIYALRQIDPKDPTRGLALFSIFNNLELCLGSLVASLPVCRPIAIKLQRTRAIQWLLSGSLSSFNSSPSDLNGVLPSHQNGRQQADADGKVKGYPPSFWSRAMVSSLGAQTSQGMDDDLYPLNETTASATENKPHTLTKDIERSNFASKDMESRPEQSPNADIHVTHEVVVR